MAIDETAYGVQSWKYFWLFVAYCIVVLIVAVFFLFYSNRILARILTFIINQYTWRQYNAYIQIDSIRVTLLGGRILFKNLRYTSNNASISIVKGHIAIKYWLFNVRDNNNDEEDKTGKDLPCRIVCNFEGLEYFIYNNIPAYDKLKDILGLSPTTTATRNSSGTSFEQLNYDQTFSSDPSNPHTSLFERLLPIQFECTKGAALIGNMELKTILVFQMVQANGIYSITKSRSSMDCYKSTIDFAVRKPQISLKDNVDFSQVRNMEDEAKEKDQSSFFRRLLKPIQRLFIGHISQPSEIQHMKNIISHEAHNDEGDGVDGEYARVSNVFECNDMVLTYYMDYAGPVPSTSSDADMIGNGGLSPEWGIRISLWDATIHYGPWADRQRIVMQNYFFPNAHRNSTPTPKLVPGQQRIPICFETYIEFMNDGKLRVPTREKTKDWKYTSGQPDLDISSDGNYTRPYGWFNIKAGEGSFVRLVTPMVIGPEGTTNTVDVVLRETDITTSVNYASFILSPKIEIQCRMPVPLQWNGYRRWDFKIIPKRATIFLLRDHIYLLQDTIRDWGSTPPPDLLHFTPTEYTLHFNLEHPSIYLCVNEHNVINNPNSIEDNAFLKLQAYKVKVDAVMPFTDFQPEINTIKFNVAIDHGSAGLSLQSSHTLNAFLNEADAQTAAVVQLNIDGSYEAYSTVDIARHIESCNLHIKMNSAKVKLFGTLIRYLLLLKDNYFGAWDHFSTIDEYREQRKNHQEWLAQKKKQADAKPTSDPFEVYMLLELEDGVLLLPENLYECSRYSQVVFQELQVELRNLDVYMDFYVNISPITLSRNINPYAQQGEEHFRIKHARAPKNSIFIDGLSIYSHRLFGPLPLSSTYLCHYELDIGRITGEIKPSFLLGLACFGQSFAYNLIDEDNAVPPELRSASLPDVTFLKVYVQEIDVCLMSLNSATNIHLSDGILLEFDNLINHKYSERITLKIPFIVTRCLANAEQTRGDGIENDYPWAEVAKADMSLNITVLRHTAEWKRKRAEQQKYVRSQDYLTRRCVRLYEMEEDYTSQYSKSSMPSTTDHHVGVLYAPPYRPFVSGRADDKSAPIDMTASSTNLSTETVKTHQGRYRGYSNSSSMSQRSLVLLKSDHMDDVSELEYDSDIEYAQSALSRDNESFHTAKDSDDEYGFGQSEITDDGYSVRSDITSMLSTEDERHAQASDDPHMSYLNEGKTPSVVPPSIPYSDYLRRYKIVHPEDHFLHPFISPPKARFVAQKEQEQKRCFSHESTTRNMDDYFSQKFGDSDEDETAYSKISNDERNEVIATTIIEATRPVTVLVTPILVKIVQELAEEIIKDDWDLETMLDALQMEYVEQLTRYLTNQYLCTRFAVVLPETYLHFIQNVTMPDDLPSYKHGGSVMKTQYNSKDTILCSADIFLNSFHMIGSVKFEDYAFDEKKKKMAESNIVLQESRIHINADEMGATVQYISKQHEQQTIAFGIPYQHLRNKSLYDRHDDHTLANEIVMLDLVLKGFDFKWLGARNPNYADVKIVDLDTVIITESVEILVGAVYSWLMFVDDLKGILQMFQEQRSRQVQVFINELADFSISPTVSGDPLFLTTPTTMLRLGSRNFRTDVGWKLLARMRHCLRSMPAMTREKLQHRLTAGNDIRIDSDAMFNDIVRCLSIWRGWEISADDIRQCRLFTQPFKQKTKAVSSIATKDMTNEVVQFLVSSSNFANFRLGKFNFVIYEEELEENGQDENSFCVQPVEFALECLYKSSPISSLPEINDGHSKLSAALDGYLDIVAKLELGKIQISINPIILAFARHMLMVQRVFKAKLRNLSSKNMTEGNQRFSSVTAGSIDEFNFGSLLSKVDIVAQTLCSLENIEITAHTQELKMDTIVSGIQGSILFSNPKLAPLQLVAHLDKDSDTGSGKRSSNRASRRTATAGPRLVLEAAGGIDSIGIKFKEEQKRNSLDPSYNTLLDIHLSKANVNANISQTTKSSKKQQGKSENTKDVLNVFSNIHKFDIKIPQSLLRLYGFFESWQTEQGRRYHFMLQNLLKEWEEQRRDVLDYSPLTKKEQPALTSLKRPDIKLQFLLNEFVVQADLLPSLSIDYNILDFFIMVNETQQKTTPVHMYAFQLSKQVIHLITKNAKQTHHGKPEIINVSTFSIPGIRSTGSLRNEASNEISQLRLRSMISVDLISMTLDASLIDSLLTAQSLVGNEVSELIEVISYSSNKKGEETPVTAVLETSQLSKPVGSVFRYTIDINLDGLRISASSPSAIGMFHSNLLEATISNDCFENSNQLAWKVKAGDFSLSVDHNMHDVPKDSEDCDIHRRNCLAYILADFSIQNSLPQCADENCENSIHYHSNDRELDALFIEFIKIQTVMQPIALGKLAEMYIYYDSELSKKKMMKKAEIDQLSANTKRIVQTISTKNDWSKTFPEEPHSLLEGRIIGLQVRRLGVAIPLDDQSDLPLPNVSKDVSALLFSAGFIEFCTKNIEKSTLQLENLALQFVKQFDQSNQDHFLAENHARMNQINLPRISCHVSASNAKPVQAISVNAQMGGFEIDIDGTIAEYINTLSVIYMKSMDRVDAFTAKASLKPKPSSSSALAVDTSGQLHSIVHLDIECKLECQTGTVRMHPKRYSWDTQLSSKRNKGLRIRTGFDAKTGEGNIVTLYIPGLLARITCLTPIGASNFATTMPKRFHADILIRESVNVLHPALVLFLSEVSTGLKIGIQQSSKRKADKSVQAGIDTTLNASILIRLSKTQLDLSCQPNSKVVCSLGWRESEFLINTFSKDATSRTMSCTGSLKEITATIKHHFSPEACFHSKIDRIMLNAVLTSQRKDGDTSDDISISVELPNILGDLNMRHLQDLLVLYNCWMVQPLLQEEYADVAKEATNSPLLTSPLDSPPSPNGRRSPDSHSSQGDAGERSFVPFSKHVAIYFDRMVLDVDLGQAIGKITICPQNLSFQGHHTPCESKGVSFTLDSVDITAEGRLTGSGHVKPITIKGRVDQFKDQDDMSSKSVAYVRSEGLQATFEYEYQNILECVQQSMEFTAEFAHINSRHELQVAILLEALVARLSIKTVPVILTMVQRFNELLEKKKSEAGIPSDGKSTLLEVPNTSRLSKERRLRKKNKQSAMHSQVALFVQFLEVIIYPSQFQDSDNVDLQAKQLTINLEEHPPEEEGIRRNLEITLDSAVLAKNVPGLELMARYNEPLSATSTSKNLSGTKIFNIPGTNIVMNSAQLESNIAYEFSSDFAGRIGVSLNIGLIKQLQEMINMFNMQLSRVLDKKSEKAHTLGDPTTPISLSSIADDSEDGGNTLSSRKASMALGTPRIQLNEAIPEEHQVQIPSMKSEETIDIETPDIKIANEEKYNYGARKPVNFQPQLQIMGDATPPVEWLGLKRERIPGLVHENITLHLNQLAKALGDLLESQTR